MHQYILEGGGGGLHEWLRALDGVADLHPRAVVAGHKNKNLPGDPAILDETRQYLQDVIRLPQSAWAEAGGVLGRGSTFTESLIRRSS